MAQPPLNALRVFEAVARHGSFRRAADELCVTQSAVSHQLRVLKDSKLVRFRREGKTVFYALDDDHVRSILSMGMDHIEE